MSIVGELFLEFALLSFVAFGGATALLPEMHRVVVENHQWLDDTTFTHLYAIAQAAPGPNVLVVTLIGWEIAGLAGALAATLAMCLPMSIVIYLLIDRWEGFAGKRWQKAISLGVEIYEIDPARCTECVGHFDEPQCVQVCPVSCIPLNPAHVETREQLLVKYQRLTAPVVG